MTSSVINENSDLVEDSGVSAGVPAGNEMDTPNAEMGTRTHTSVVRDIESIINDPIG